MSAPKMHTTVLRTVCLCLLGLMLLACSTLPPEGIQPVTGFDVQRYTGTWYEIARLDHSFERGLTDVSARYTVNADGSVTVLNRGYSPDKQRWKQAEGHAQFNGEPTEASLKVSFFGPFYGGYHVIALDTSYRWALVAGNDRDFLWILARDKTLDDAVKTRLMAQARALGFAVDKLVWVSQQRNDG